LTRLITLWFPKASETEPNPWEASLSHNCFRACFSGLKGAFSDESPWVMCLDLRFNATGALLLAKGWEGQKALCKG